MGQGSSEWFTSFIQKHSSLKQSNVTYHLMKVSEPRVMETDSKWGFCATELDRVAMQDSTPVNIASSRSLNFLNQSYLRRAEAEVDIRRFRPNIVLDGGGIFEESKWQRLRFFSTKHGTDSGTPTKQASDPYLELRFIRHCHRCTMTTINPDTGKLPANGVEPLTSLRRFRSAKHVVTDKRLVDNYGAAPLFAVNFGFQWSSPHPLGTDVISLGDIVEYAPASESTISDGAKQKKM